MFKYSYDYKWSIVQDQNDIRKDNIKLHKKVQNPNCLNADAKMKP